MSSEIEVADSSNGQVAYAFLEWLQQLQQTGTFNEDAMESVEVANQCIQSVFGFQFNDPEAQKKFSIKPHSLPTVLGLGLAGKEKLAQALNKLHASSLDSNDHETKFFQYIQTLKKRGFFNGVNIGTPEYETRFTRAREKFNEKFSTPSATPAPTAQTTTTSTTTTTPAETKPVEPELSSKEKNALAEKHKTEGNQKLAEKQYTSAVECYTKAIQLNPNNAIYYSNRAAAYTHLGLHERAIEDCNQSIQVNPAYSKAYGRLGLAYFSLGKFQESVDAYKKGLEYEPNSQAYKESLAAAEVKLTSPQPQAQPRGPGGVNFNDMLNNPQFANLANMFGGGQPGSGTGQTPNLNDLMSSPMMQQMMSNPQVMNMAQNLMQNPDAMGNLMKAFGMGNQ